MQILGDGGGSILGDRDLQEPWTGGERPRAPRGEQPGEAGGTRSGRAEECGFYFVGDREPLSVFGPGRGELNRNQRTSFSGLS